MDQTEQWHLYFEAAHQLSHLEDEKKITLNLERLMGSNLKDFWRYDGSLTTPPCTENVIWTVFREEINLIGTDLDSFRHDLFFESYRGPQFLFNRKVYRSFATEKSSSIPDQQCCFNLSIKLLATPLRSFFFSFCYFLYYTLKL